ncbi:hypothetical protein MUY27_09690 [Mucilaginibacter sp. RS28]|uniref:Uncharacterized protein n=1 Tax=Mucilaginibacter straminoryzae TaxID=2932774 RepID=A0A9X1X4K2_9SPHI|nr:hypothetical protein [Mucilaginibacter straminoryzae]MCJ8209980.1 hypothetical protein [Mucilaginibacter straminoryzae]
MAAFNDAPLKEREDLYTTDELNYSRFWSVATPDPDDDDLLEDDDDLDEDDLDDDTLGDDTDLDDEDFEDDDLIDDEEEEDDDDIVAGTNQTFTAEADTDPIDDDEELDPDLSPDETPEREESDNEDLRYPKETETRPGDSQSSSDWSEQIDVTPPTPHEFPGEGNTKADFHSRPFGRSSSRIIGSDPGLGGE